ncbi:MAG: hypothetical protein ACI8ZM_003518 [Crocinitomix sp.]|jgi:hypothetical protein
MKNQTSINKVQFQNQLVNAMLATDPRLSFKHFNNRRYYFYYANAHDISVLLELRVHLNNKYIAVVVNSKSTLKETECTLKYPFHNNGFLDLKAYRHFRFEPSRQVLIRAVAEEIHASLIATYEKHAHEVLLSRTGIELGMQYELEHSEVVFDFLSMYSSRDLASIENEQFKALYIHLFKSLDMASSKIEDFRIMYVLLSIIQVVLTNKQIPFSNPVH